MTLLEFKKEDLETSTMTIRLLSDLVFIASLSAIVMIPHSPWFQFLNLQRDLQQHFPNHCFKVPTGVSAGKSESCPVQAFWSEYLLLFLLHLFFYGNCLFPTPKWFWWCYQSWPCFLCHSGSQLMFSFSLNTSVVHVTQARLIIGLFRVHFRAWYEMQRENVALFPLDQNLWSISCINSISLEFPYLLLPQSQESITENEANIYARTTLKKKKRKEALIIF